MQAHRALGLIVLSLAACGGSPVGDDEQAIQGGAADRGDPAVGLVWFEGGGFCSGTLIAPSVVLTAGHCVQEPIEGFYTGSGKATSRVGMTPPAGMERHAVVAAESHPSYRAGNSCPNTTFDLGLVRLARPIDSIAPVPLNPGAPATGDDCTAVGFGTHDTTTSTSYEAKRSASERVLAAGRTWLRLEAGSGIADHGDSGGPLLCRGRIVGVTSCGNASAYGQEVYDARVDTVIEQAAQRWGAN